MVENSSEVKRDLKKMILPTLSGMLVTFMFQLVDTYFIGKLGEIELAAISFTYPIYIAMISIFMGLAVGLSVSVSYAFGLNEQKRIKSLTSSALISTLISSVLVSYIVYILRNDIYLLLGADIQMHSTIDEYMPIILMGMPFLMITLNAIASLRSTGRALVPELIMAFGGIVNLILDYIFIFGFYNIEAMGIKGAALATVISWLIVLVIILIMLIKYKYISYNLDFIKSNKSILSIAIPAIGVQLITPISMAIITKFVALKGPLAIAALGIATKIESLSLTIILALSIVIVPIAAKNYSAKKTKNFNELVALSGKISIYWSVFLYLIIIVFSKTIAQLFTSSQEIVDMISSYLMIVGLTYPLISITLVTNSIFNAVGKSKESLKISIVKSVILLIPLVYIASSYNIKTVWISLLLANTLGAIYAIKRFRIWLKDTDSSLQNISIVKEYTNDIKKIIRK